ncbi:aspartate aminotransferase family protein [Primorskyibacter flagellatus]|uniref:Aspartate aminotransferase family protein n=1 Tax=Primorskyibacter flagellatus TaxID=1387277 RepID=A0A917AE72_9RHOB|nr:aspartate aminotransferase family protein [Primorskyibacter flagellatus]GGE47020.1 aspartate aminotransferase family protein [Primorskyibacter flagellatus]
MTTHVFHRTPVRPAIATEARGIEITDETGKVYIDGSGGAAVSCIGHGDMRVVEAIAKQAATVEYAHTGAFTSPPAEELAEVLCNATTLPMARVFLVGSGSEAVETAVKMARGYHLARGDEGRFRVIARRQSYHGNTLGALARGGNFGRRAPYLPMMTEAHLVDPCFEYRHALPGETPETYGRRAADSLEAEILRLGPETVSAFLVETVVGATTGAVPPAPGYFARIREICDRHGILLIADEVMCGVNRCGPFFAIEDEGVCPDIVTLGKGLGGGYQPIAAAMCTAAVHDAFSDVGRSFINGHTYMAHPVACAAALAVQQVIRDDGLAERVAPMGTYLKQRLEARFGNHPYVGDIRGQGLFQAIEIVADRNSKTPFPATEAMASRIFAACRDIGLLCYPGSGTADGTIGDHLLVAPPYSVTTAEIDTIVERLGDGVDAGLAQAGG